MYLSDNTVTAAEVGVLFLLAANPFTTSVVATVTGFSGWGTAALLAVLAAWVTFRRISARAQRAEASEKE